MRYVTVEEVIGINVALLDSQPVVRDAGLLAGAVQRPAQVVFGEEVYPSLWDKAAVLFESLCKDQAFAQENTNTAVIAMSHMLFWNLWRLEADEMELVELTDDVVGRRTHWQKVAEWIQLHAEPLDLSSLDDIDDSGVFDDDE